VTTQHNVEIYIMITQLTISIRVLCTNGSAIDDHPFGVTNRNAGMLNFLTRLSRVQGSRQKKPGARILDDSHRERNKQEPSTIENRQEFWHLASRRGERHT
jgi:hypothetical protein